MYVVPFFFFFNLSRSQTTIPPLLYQCSRARTPARPSLASPARQSYVRSGGLSAGRSGRVLRRLLYLARQFVCRAPPADICTLNRNSLVTSRFKVSQYLSGRPSAAPLRVHRRRRRPRGPSGRLSLSHSLSLREEDQSAYWTFSLRSVGRRRMYFAVFVDLLEL